MNQVIKRFKIEGLFNEYNVDIDFNDAVKILVGENGTGKTTILNAFYYTISTKFQKLKDIDFNKIILEFISGKSVTIYKEAIFDWEKQRMPIEFKRMQRFLGNDSFNDLMYLLKKGEKIEGTKYEYLLEDIGLSPQRVQRYADMLSLSERYFELSEAEKIIKSEIKGKIIYLPTYRRVEEELLNLGIDLDFKNKFDNSDLIRFGLEDIQHMINKITSDIKSAYKYGFSKISAEILLDMVSNVDFENTTLEAFEKLRIIVDRIDETILSDKEKNSIKSYINNRDSKDENIGKYNYFLSKLIKIYDEQSEKESKILKFMEVCNGYLVNKKFHYNESLVEVSVRELNTNRTIKLNKLSSGEKQIVSLFAGLYLDENNDYYVLFDEPELSLSIEWQQKLLPNIYDSKKCRLLMAVTHSPFIFENELDCYAAGLDVYMGEVK